MTRTPPGGISSNLSAQRHRELELGEGSCNLPLHYERGWREAVVGSPEFDFS